MKIFVDPSSKSLLELGTFDHPYKTIEMPFLEIQRFYWNTQHMAQVFIKEMNNLNMRQKEIYIMNMTMIKVSTYGFDHSDPSRPKFRQEQASIIL